MVGLYTINVRGDKNANRTVALSDRQFEVALVDTNNYVWKAAQNAETLVTTYEILPFNIDDEEDDIEVLITLPSYILYTGEEVRPNVRAT